MIEPMNTSKYPLQHQTLKFASFMNDTICFPPKFPVQWLYKRPHNVSEDVFENSVLSPIVDHFEAIDEVVQDSVTGAIILGSGVELQDLHIKDDQKHAS